MVGHGFQSTPSRFAWIIRTKQLKVKVKIVGIFRVPSTWNPSKSMTANATVERSCTICRLGLSNRVRC